MTSETYQDVLAAAKRMPPAAQAELVAMSALQRTSHARRRVDSAVLCPGISLLATLHGRLCTSDRNLALKHSVAQHGLIGIMTYASGSAAILAAAGKMPALPGLLCPSTG